MPEFGCNNADCRASIWGLDLVPQRKDNVHILKKVPEVIEAMFFSHVTSLLRQRLKKWNIHSCFIITEQYIFKIDAYCSELFKKFKLLPIFAVKHKTLLNA